MKCEVMGVVNVTPDSFSDGGKYSRPEEAVRRALNCVADGAAIIDIGGESTRPGATPLDWQTEWDRIEPVLAELTKRVSASVRISVDTYHPETAERALRLGARIVNCVYPEPIAAMLNLCAKAKAELVLPAQCADTLPVGLLRDVPHYLDPMIGFGTTRERDLELLRSIPNLARRGRVLVGASRKRIVKRLTGVKVAGKDLAGNLAIAIWAAQNGASAVRVHDVAETVQALGVYGVIANGKTNDVAED